jgi:hypothetical protein
VNHQHHQPDTRTAATQLAQAGAAVFPCHDKTPMVKWNAWATTNPDQVAATWPSHANAIGIACGPSRLLVVDLDTPKPETIRPAHLDPAVTSGIDVFTAICEQHQQAWPDTYTVRTGRGGLHLYFHNPDPARFRNTNSDRGKGIGWLIDTRGGGGFVIAPPSVVNGLPYTVARDLPVNPLPAWLSRLLDPPHIVRKPAGPPPRINDAYLAAAVRNSIDTVLAATPGTRNDVLNTAAYSLGRLVGTGKLSPITVRIALQAAGEAVGLTPGETTKTIHSGLTKGAQNPRPMAARR